MKNLICHMFGHKSPSYAAHKGWGGYEYAELGAPYIDGIGRQHARVTGECARCNMRFFICMVHVPVLAAKPEGGE